MQLRAVWATDEIGAFIPAMDFVPDIAGRTVTADALFSQTAVSACLHGPGRPLHVRRQAQPEGNLLKEIRGHFASQCARPADFATRSPQPEHGQIEQREVWVFTDRVHRLSFPGVGQVYPFA